MRVSAGLLCLLVAACPVLAQDKGKGAKAPPPPPKMTEEQKRKALKASCSKEAEDLKLKSDARKSFLAGCMGEQLADAGDKSRKDTKDTKDTKDKKP